MTIINANCLTMGLYLAENSVDAIVCDPPYELGFMGKSWDASGIAYSVPMWREVLRVLKPGGHLLAFSGSRTYHRMVCAIEDAGFEVRDQLMWVYGSGFPKSHNLEGDWDGWGTALKPAHEPIVLARKPLAKGCTVAGNVLAHGTGALNIDGCRVESYDGASTARKPSSTENTTSYGKSKMMGGNGSTLGRWPANLIHDGTDEVLAAFPADAGRFFYCAKASQKDRNEGLEGFTPATTSDGPAVAADNAYQRGKTERLNIHPTVKPTDLMRYLCRLITPPGGTVLDPFAGSGSTGKAATLEGFQFIGFELSPEYAAIAEARIAACQS